MESHETDMEAKSSEEWLKLAIARHERHMNGTEKTSRDSQMLMMIEMKLSLNALVSNKPVPPTKWYFQLTRS